ncbi:hypothetical protein [Chitinophaga ginsengisoli]|uniref:Uncharacterized protein n=1 Tax=Chitinophaga ginsengisoli TaxID=363837 RepID=A0A2P8G4T7_9BACT|nr:hypothetical protein [Chitinophaga ginsengisoli]PSL28993.1 hypothetical protein CLV42_107139 [Chitinophaga ginsengisoli]
MSRQNLHEQEDILQVEATGIIKRDITYSSDVLNTTSRIQNMRREFNQEVIVSGDLAASLRLAGNFVTQTLGSIKLKGKQKEMLLIALKSGITE